MLDERPEVRYCDERKIYYVDQRYCGIRVQIRRKKKIDVSKILDKKISWIESRAKNNFRQDIYLGEALVKYFEILPKKSTQYDVKPKLVFFEEFLGKDTVFSDIGNKEIHNSVIELENRGLSANTINKYISTFNQVYKFVEHKLDLPVGNFQSERFRKKITNKPIVYLSNSELEIVLEEAKNNSDYLYNTIKFASLTGLRRTNILNLKWDQIYWDKKEIHFEDIEMKAGEHFIFPLYKELENHLSSIKKLNSFYVFTDDEGNRIKDPKKRFANFKSKLNSLYGIDLKDKQWHAFRSTAATKLQKIGFQPEEVQYLLNHKDYKTTSRYYTAMQHNEIRKKLDNLEKRDE